MPDDHPSPKRDPKARSLAWLLGTFHNLSYYAPEMKAFADVGLPEYWRAYIAFRSAPLGVVPAPVVTSTFYNFAPTVVERSIPSSWELISPADAISLRDTCTEQGVRRALGDLVDSSEVAEAAELALEGIDGCDVVARPLFGAHVDLPVPTEAHQRLWHACTLWREHRGDSHNIALAAAGIDGVQCHVLLAAKGVCTQEVIEKIRGWTADEWSGAVQRLAERGLLDDDGGFTAEGRTLRDSIELHTDQLTDEPRQRLGPANCTRLIELMEPIVERLVSSGAVPGSWPGPRHQSQ